MEVSDEEISDKKIEKESGSLQVLGVRSILRAHPTDLGTELMFKIFKVNTDGLDGKKT